VSEVRALVLIDGEHYAPVVRDALAELPYEIIGAVLVGGTEKLRGGEDYGVPLVESLDAGRPALVVGREGARVRPRAMRLDGHDAGCHAREELAVVGDE